MFEQMKGLTPKKKVQYFIDYYGLATLVAAAVAIAVISFIVHQVTAKDSAGGVILINSVALVSEEESQEEIYLEDLLSSLGIDPDRNEISVNSNIYLGETVDAETQVISIQLLQALVMSDSADVVFVDDTYYEKFLENDVLVDLRDYLDEDVLERHKDDLVYYDSEAEGGEIAAAVRISSDSEWNKGTCWYLSDSYAGIIAGTEHRELAVHLLLRAMGEEAFYTHGK